MGVTVFIDGEAGTTGLGIARRLERMPQIRLLHLPDADRKSPAARLEAMRAAEIVILCLPDDAARAAVAQAATLGTAAPRLLDASTAHRVAPGWVYGFAELDRGQPARIAAAAQVANPGCYATAAIALLRPLVARGLVAPTQPLSLHAVSGYSGGGRAMIASHDDQGGPAFELYGLGLDHKHLPEIMAHAGLARPPIFVPAVGHFAQGMLVLLPLHLDQLPGRPAAADLAASLAAHYPAAGQVRLIQADPADRLVAQAMAGSDRLEIRVYDRAETGQVLLVASLDNLGKGASGAAIQNLCLMLGIDQP